MRSNGFHIERSVLGCALAGRWAGSTNFNWLDGVVVDRMGSGKLMDGGSFKVGRRPLGHDLP